MSMKIRILKTALAAAVVLIGAQAYGRTVAFFARPGNFFFSSQPVFVPLNSAGATQVTYSGSGRRTITYTAECANEVPLGTVTIDILVDGVPLAPTGGNDDDTFCSAGSFQEFEFEGAVMAAAMGRTANLPSGAHTVRVVARAVNGNGAGLLGDSALLITD
jgi:hypothetical protein